MAVKEKKCDKGWKVQLTHVAQVLTVKKYGKNEWVN